MKNRNIRKVIIGITTAVILLSVLLVSSCVSGGAVSVPKGWSGPVEGNGSVYVGTMEGNIASVNLSDNSLWTVPLEEPTSGGGFLGCSQASTTIAIYGSPSVFENLVFIAGYNGKVYAFSPGKTDPRWVYPRQDFLGPIVGGTTVDQGNLYFGATDHKVYALDAAEGYKLWEFETGDQIWSTPTVSGGILYIGSFDQKLYALNTADGTKKWEFESGGTIVATPLVVNGAVYIGSFDRNLYSVNAATGQQNWSYSGGNWFWAKPALNGNTIYAGCLDGKVYALNSATGSLIKEYDLGSPVSSDLTVADNLVVAATEEGKLYTFDASGNQRELADLGEKIYSALSTSGGKVYVHTAGDSLYSVDAATGAVQQINIK